MPGEYDEEAIFKAAVKLKSDVDRTTYLKTACGDNPSLFARIRILLESHDKAGNFLETPPFLDKPPLDELPEEALGTVIGCYKLLEKIGEGGMATIYMAEQDKPIRRQVALKIIKLGMDTRQVIARFEAERQALALMDHPNISKIFDAGATETGRPYFVMELVRGVSITKYCDENNLDIQKRLELFIQICNAVQHAHQKGIIHRDIKPTNILVTQHDDKSVPKVIDFGIAKAINQRLTEKTMFTCKAQLIGTPEYMSPEQACMSEQDIDTRTDIYSLGALLYELMTGNTPFDTQTLRQAGYDEIQRIICKQEPVKPSTRLCTLIDTLPDIARRRLTDPKLLPKMIQGDIDWIAMKTLEKDRTHRYGTVGDLAQDIQRHLRHEPISVHKPSAIHLVRKFVRRHRLGVAFGLAMAAVLLLGLSAAIVGFVKASREADRAWRAEQAAQREKGATQQALDKLAMQKKHTDQLLYYQSIELAKQAADESNYAVAKNHLRDCPEHLLGWEWGWMQYVCNLDVFTFGPNRGYACATTFSPCGKYLAAGLHRYNIVHIWSLETGELCHTFYPQNMLDIDDRVLSVKFSPDGRFLAAGSFFNWDKYQYNTVTLWEVTTGKEVLVLKGHLRGTMGLCFSPDGKILATSGSQNHEMDDCTITLWDIYRGTLLKEFKDHRSQVRDLSFSKDGQLLIAGDRSEGSVYVWNIKDGKRIKDYRGDTRLHFSVPDQTGTRFARVATDNTVEIWERDTEQIHAIQPGKSVSEMAFHPGGHHLAIGLTDGCLQLWDIDTRTKLREIKGHAGSIKSLSYDTGGKFLVTADINRYIKVWNVSLTGDKHLLKAHQGMVTQAEFHPQDETLATASSDHTTIIWDAQTRQPRLTLRDHTHPINDISFGPDNRLIATASEDRTVRIWDVNTGQCREILGPFRLPINSIAFNDQGTHLICHEWGDKIHILDLKTQVCTQLFPANDVYSTAYSPDKQWMALGERMGRISIYNLVTGKQIRYSQRHQGRVVSLCFSPDSQELISVGEDGRLVKWQYPMDQHQVLDSSLGRNVSVVAFGPEGKRIFLGFERGSIQIRNAENGRELLTFAAHQGTINDLKFSRDGRRMISCGADNLAILWPTFPWKKQDYPDPGLLTDGNLMNSYKRSYWQGEQVIAASKALSPEETVVYWKIIGAMHGRNNQWEEVVNALEKAQSLNGELDGYDLLLLAQAYAKLQNLELAQRWYQQAITYIEQARTVHPSLYSLQANVSTLLKNLEKINNKDESDHREAPTSLPYPETGMDISAMPEVYLRWPCVPEAISYKIYFGTDTQELSVLTEVYENNYVKSPPLQKHQWYVWRVDASFSDGSIQEGPLWSFSAGNMVGWWDFDQIQDGRVQDKSGMGNDGICRGDTKPRPGWKGQALQFDSEGDYVYLENEHRFDLVHQITIALWIKVYAFNRWHQAIFNKGDTAWGIQRYAYLDYLCFFCNDLYPQRTVISKTPINDDQWHHVAGVYDGKVLYLYIDGVLDNSVPAEGKIACNGYPPTIGGNLERKSQSPLEPTYGFFGLLDDVRIYSYALNSDEIKSLYEGQGPGPLPRPNLPSDINQDTSPKITMEVLSH
jgi:eukaryotic-like serine/threonine-protein kinase